MPPTLPPPVSTTTTTTQPPAIPPTKPPSPPSSSVSPVTPTADLRQSRSSTTSIRPIHSIKSTDSLPSKGRQLLQTFDKARTDFATKYGGDDEVATVTFCQQILARGCPELANKWEVVHSVSCGTTSVVCHAVPRHQHDGLPPVAIKFARLVFSPNDRTGIAERKRQFEIEAKLMSRCAGEHVVKLLRFVPSVEGFAIFVMEYLPKTLLEHTVESNERGAHHELQAAKHVRSIAAALHECHKQDIAHLDVKLDNVLCTANGEAKLCDFGLADLVPVRRAAATPLYAPPEILLNARADKKCDMWSLGVVAYILLAGYPPFQPDDEHELKDNICYARYSFPPDEGWGEVSALARDLVSKLLVLDPQHRWSAEQVLEHPWIVAAGAAPPIPATPSVPVSSLPSQPLAPPPPSNGPPMLKRADSVVNLERMAHRQLMEKQQSRLRSLSQFREFAEDIRKGWRESGWEGVAAVGRGDPGISSLVAVAEDVKRGWKTNGLKGARTALSQGRGKLRASFVSSTDDLHGHDVGEDNDNDGGNNEEEEGDDLMNELHGMDRQYVKKNEDTNTDETRTIDGFLDRQSSNGTTNSGLVESRHSSSDVTGKSISDSTTFLISMPPSPQSPPPSNPAALNPYDDKAFLKVYWGSTNLKHAPYWIPDGEAHACRLCLGLFTFWHRRHHCRACGQVVCDQCSKTRMVVKYVDRVKPVRVCVLCRDGLVAEGATVVV